MKNMKLIYIVFVSLLFSIVFTNCQDDTIKPSSICQYDAVLESIVDSSSFHPRVNDYQQIVDKYVALGLPGIVIMIEDSNGVCITYGGKADIENDIDMMPCTVSKVASITKFFMGTLTMILYEEGRINLDDPISKYVDEKIIKKIENADVTTIRQLLNHTSGIYDHVTDQSFYLKLLNNPNHDWRPEELLKFVYGKPGLFENGKDAQYSNTNFLLLSMVIDEVTGTSHADLMRSKIIEPLGLNETYYHWHDDLPSYTAQGYFDLYNNGNILNMSNYHTGSGNGYGGIYSTVKDLNTFLNALLVDKTLISENTLENVMKNYTTFVEVDEGGEKRNFGLGIFRQQLKGHPNDEYGLGHGGRDLQYSADLYFFPKNGTRLSYLVNYGTNGSSTLKPVFDDFRTEVMEKIFSAD